MHNQCGKKEVCRYDSETLLLVTQGETTTKLKAPRMLAIPPAILTNILDANGSITPHTLWKKFFEKMTTGAWTTMTGNLSLTGAKWPNMPSLLPMYLQAS
jgi:hypothetical protein